MQCSTDQRPNLTLVLRLGELKPPLRSPFLGDCVPQRLRNSRTCRQISHFRLCSAGSQAKVGDADLSGCRCNACTASIGALSSHKQCSSHRRHCATLARAASSPEIAPSLADASSTAARESSGQSDTNGAGNGEASIGKGSLQHAEVLESSSASGQLVRAPEDLTLEPGSLSSIDRGGSCHPADVFRCTGCTEPACQVRATCHQLLKTT